MSGTRSARSEFLIANQGWGHGPRTLVLRAPQSFVYRELTERVIVVIVIVIVFVGVWRQGSQGLGFSGVLLAVELEIVCGVCFSSLWAGGGYFFSCFLRPFVFLDTVVDRKLHVCERKMLMLVVFFFGRNGKYQEHGALVTAHPRTL